MTCRRMREQSAERRSKDESEIVSSAQPRHALGPLVGWCDVGDIALDDCPISARETAQKPDKKSDVHIGREGEREIAEAVTGDSTNQQWLATNSIGQPAPEGLAEKRTNGICR